MYSYKQRRLDLDITQKQIANLVGVSESTVSRWESGDISNMRRDKIRKYAEALKTSTEFILGDSMLLENNFSDEKALNNELKSVEEDFSRPKSQLKPHEKNETIVDIIVRVRTDDVFLSLVAAMEKNNEFFAAVRALHTLDSEKDKVTHDMLNNIV